MILRFQALSCHLEVISILLGNSSTVTPGVHKLAKVSDFPGLIVTQLRVLVEHVGGLGLAFLVLLFRLVF